MRPAPLQLPMVLRHCPWVFCAHSSPFCHQRFCASVQLVPYVWVMTAADILAVYSSTCALTQWTARSLCILFAIWSQIGLVYSRCFPPVLHPAALRRRRTHVLSIMMITRVRFIVRSRATAYDSALGGGGVSPWTVPFACRGSPPYIPEAIRHVTPVGHSGRSGASVYVMHPVPAFCAA